MALYGNPLGGGGYRRRPTRLVAALQNRGLGPFPAGGPVRRPVGAGYGFGQLAGALGGIQGQLGQGGGSAFTGGAGAAATPQPLGGIGAFGGYPANDQAPYSDRPLPVSPPIFRRATGYMKPRRPRPYGGYGGYGFGGPIA